MKSLANAAYEFIVEKEAAASEPFFGSEILPSLYHEISVKGDRKFVRVGDVQTSQPMPIGSGATREFNAFLTIQIIVRPVSLKHLEHLLEAREDATAIALELSKLIDDSHNLGNRVCDVQVARKEDTWSNVGTIRHAVSFLLLKFNSR